MENLETLLKDAEVIGQQKVLIKVRDYAIENQLHGLFDFTEEILKDIQISELQLQLSER